MAFKVWVCGALVSQFGDAAMYFALGWAASAHGGTAAGLVLSGIVLPRTALLLVGGVTGDRIGARRVMITGDAIMLVGAVGLGLIARRSGTSLPLLLAAAVIIGIVDAFYLPSSGSSLDGSSTTRSWLARSRCAKAEAN
jgi:MFS family permease